MFFSSLSPLLSKGITAIRFAEHQRCYIRAQTKKLPAVAEVEAEDAELPVRPPLTPTNPPILTALLPLLPPIAFMAVGSSDQPTEAESCIL